MEQAEYVRTIKQNKTRDCNKGQTRNAVNGFHLS